MSKANTLVIPTMKDNPFELGLLVASFILGVRGVITTNTEGILYRTIGPWSDAWNVGLIVAVGICVVSLFLKPGDNLLWERLGISLLVTVFSSFLVTGIVLTQSITFNNIYIAIIVTFGGIGRIIQISHHLKFLKKLVELRRGDNDDH